METTTESEQQRQPDIRFEKTNDEHRITFDPQDTGFIPAALAMAAFNRARVARGGFLIGHKGYKSDIDAETATELVEQTANKKIGQLFFLDYVYGKEVKVGARRNQDGSITLIDRQGNPIPEKAAQAITESADGYFWDVREMGKEE